METQPSTITRLVKNRCTIPARQNKKKKSGAAFLVFRKKSHESTFGGTVKEMR
jgi:hypothetical protein